MMHTVGVWERLGDSERDYMPPVHDLLKEAGEMAGDLTVIIRHFAMSDDDEIAPPWLISSLPANWRGGQARSR